MVFPKDVFELNCSIFWTVFLRLMDLFWACLGLFYLFGPVLDVFYLFWTRFTCFGPVLPILGLFYLFLGVPWIIPSALRGRLIPALGMFFRLFRAWFTCF